MNISISPRRMPLGELSRLRQYYSAPSGVGATMSGAAVAGVAAGGGGVGARAERTASAAALKEDPKLLPSGVKPVIRATAKSDAIMP